MQLQRRRKLFCIGQADKSDREEEGGYVHVLAATNFQLAIAIAVPCTCIVIHAEFITFIHAMCLKVAGTCLWATVVASFQ